MEEGIERELKFKLPDRAAYDRLAEALGTEIRREAQTNYFLDTVNGDIARSRRSVMRVRDRGTRFTTTFKWGQDGQDGYFQAEEIQVEIPAELAERMRQGELPVAARALAPIRRLIEVFGPQERLVPQGIMRNLRRVFELSGSDMAELDETTYTDGSIDYELEVETDEPGRVRSVLELLGFADLEPQDKTKYARFLERR
jgi:uncharacterized protein YjbK